MTSIHSEYWFHLLYDWSIHLIVALVLISVYIIGRFILPWLDRQEIRRKQKELIRTHKKYSHYLPKKP